MSTDIEWLKARIMGVGAPVVIDGGMGTLLEKTGISMDDKVWSARANLSHPDAVRQAHEEFILAGAEVIITNTFSAARHMLEPGGLGDRVVDINQTAVTLAQRARAIVADRPIAIAGSVCEWTSSDDPRWHTVEAVAHSSKEQIGYLVDAGVDLIAVEMCEQLEFSVAAVDAAFEYDLPVWIGVSAKTHRNSHSLSVFSYAERDFEELVKALSTYPAMMINLMHTPVTDIDQAVEVIRRYWQGPLGIYPESGYFNMPNWQFVDIIDPAKLATAAQSWIDNGIRLVGGCCGLGPEHIAALRGVVHENESA